MGKVVFKTVFDIFQRQYLADVQMDINQTLNTPPLLLDIPCTAVLDLAQDEQIYWQFVKIWKISTQGT